MAQVVDAARTSPVRLAHPSECAQVPTRLVRPCQPPAGPGGLLSPEGYRSLSGLGRCGLVCRRVRSLLVLAPLEACAGFGAVLPSLEDVLVGQLWSLGRAARLQRHHIRPGTAVTASAGPIVGTGALAAPERKNRSLPAPPGRPGTGRAVTRRDHHAEFAVSVVPRSDGATKSQVIRTETTPCATDGW